MYRQAFRVAPWGRVVRLATVVTHVLLLGIAAAGILTGPESFWLWCLPMVWLPVAFLLVAPFFMIRRYVLEENSLRICRLGWGSDIPLDRVESVYHDPEAMRRAWRLFGNGGLFCFAGLFRTKELGNFRAFVTDPRHAVVIRTLERTVIISPADPEAFVAALAERLGPTGDVS